MTLLAARHFLPIEHRNDWDRGHLTYMPRGLYTRIVRSFDWRAAR
jgi:hypothetical protein